RAAMRDRLVVDGPTGPAWAWACDAEGNTETRDEPPLGLRTLPYWGVGTVDDPVNRATRAWLADHNPHRVAGRFPGAGSPHFPHPSGFDLANRLLVGDAADGDPLDQLVEVPMDEGLACESWDVDTGQVRTGAAMASMAGLLVWTAWEHLAGRRRWDQPPGHGAAGR
ncbi:MAG TPA: glycoside hydrolase family 125 protein, partial [Acidimicrobiales bacterium]|nr:glycoside hydrolase family 125 protein [Acidimicrobiales bacterium]